MRGHPWLVRFFVGFHKPKNHILGWDVAGRVEAVGANVKRFQPGDEVFGACSGTLAEFASATEDRFAPKPANLSFAQAAAVPTVCSTRNLDLVRSLGADHVVDYTLEDFTRRGERYDLILDNVGNRSFADCRRALAPGGTLLPNTGHAGMGYVIMAFARSVFVRQQDRPLLVTPKAEELVTLTAWIEAEKLTPIIDRTYRLDEAREALSYVGEGHARGKVVIVVAQTDPARF